MHDARKMHDGEQITRDESGRFDRRGKNDTDGETGRRIQKMARERITAWAYSQKKNRSIPVYTPRLFNRFLSSAFPPHQIVVKGAKTTTIGQGLEYLAIVSGRTRPPFISEHQVIASVSNPPGDHKRSAVSAAVALHIIPSYLFPICSMGLYHAVMIKQERRLAPSLSFVLWACIALRLGEGYNTPPPARRSLSVQFSLSCFVSFIVSCTVTNHASIVIMNPRPAPES